MWQSIAVGVIVAAAVVYLAGKYGKALFGKGTPACGCQDSTGGCSPACGQGAGPARGENPCACCGRRPPAGN